MYPGPGWQPLPSIRLKNLRDGMQDYEYFMMLKKNVDALKNRGQDKELVKRAEELLGLTKVVGGATSYTKDPAILNQTKAELAELIIQSQELLKKGD